MKKVSLFVLFALFGAGAFAQAPEMINYQCVVRTIDGYSITNQLVGVRVAILQGSAVGPEVFAETHGPTTNDYGLINIQIGTGSNTGPTLDQVDWSANLYFLKVEIDPTGGTSYSVSSTSQLISVPFALYAKTAGNVDDADADPTNEFNISANVNGTDLEITDGGGTITADLTTVMSDPDMDPNNEIQVLQKVGNIITLSPSGGAVTDDVNDADPDPTNEYNTTLTLVGSTLQLTDAGGTLNADLSSIQNDADADPTNEFNATLILVGSTLQLTDGGGTLNADLSSIQNDADADPTNEFNTGALLVGNNLAITDGGGTLLVDLSSLANDADSDPTNEFQTVNQVGSNVTLSDGGGTFSINDNDADATNEFNTSASLTGNDLNITDGGGTITVDLSPIAGGGGNPTDELNTILNLNGTTLELTDAGGMLTADLSSLVGGGDPSSTNEFNTNVQLVGNNLQVTDAGGTLSADLSGLIDDADADPTNEYNTTLNLNGNTLELTDGGGMLTADLSSLGGGGSGFYVGQQYQGGVIFYVDSSGQHGLIVGPTDIGTGVLFEAAPNQLTVFASDFTDGAANTNTLVNGAGAPHGFTAAALCDAYSTAGFSDWYLPAAYELELLLRANLALAYSSVDMTLGAFYWSSTEDPAAAGFNAYRVRNNTTYIETTSQGNSANVRPIRAF